MPINKSWGCSKCEAQFASKDDLIIHVKKHIIAKSEPLKKEELKAKPGQIVLSTSTPVKTPIKLTYLYKGQCPDCAGPITTLEIDVEKKHFYIAMCNRCNKQLDTREVKKL